MSSLLCHFVFVLLYLCFDAIVWQVEGVWDDATLISHCCLAYLIVIVSLYLCFDAIVWQVEGVWEGLKSHQRLHDDDDVAYP
jgi:hypothetical protein